MTQQLACPQQVLQLTSESLGFCPTSDHYQIPLQNLTCRAPDGLPASKASFAMFRYTLAAIAGDEGIHSGACKGGSSGIRFISSQSALERAVVMMARFDEDMYMLHEYEQELGELTSN
jgi:hypothetical protein